MKRLLPILLVAILGLLGGAGAGAFLKPPPPLESEDHAKDGDSASHDEASVESDGEASHETAAKEPAKPPKPTAPELPTDAAEDAAIDFVKIERQFVIPVIEDGQISSLVLMSIALEVKEGSSEVVFEREPKLRDAFLQVFFAHSQAGGFDGSFTRESRLADLRVALLAAARNVLGELAQGILLTNILRQDV